MLRATYYLETHGCTLNSSDSELIAGILHGAGIDEVGSPGDADFIILNTCGVKTATEQKILHRIRQYARLDGRILVIAGCLPLILKDDLGALMRLAPGFGAMVGPRNYHELSGVIDALRGGTRNIVRIDGASLGAKERLEPRRPHGHVAILPIAEGCTGACTYCCTRFARGSLDCYNASHLVDKFSRYVVAGAREVFLTAEDCSAYLDPAEGVTLPGLVDRLLEKPGGYHLRIGMMNPGTLLRVHEHLVRAMRDPRVFAFAHVPVQSGSDRVLRAMNRTYSVADFTGMIDAFKAAIPGITIATDVICGFPGETDGDFQQTVDLLLRIRPDVVNISKYGHRPGTAASKLKQIDSGTVKARTRELTAAHERVTMRNNEEWVGWEGEAIIEEYNEKNGNWLARNRFYKPIIVGRGILGGTVRVEITGAAPHHLIGKVTC
ncbi:MAG: tRNA (N(6)-L-threonylcarbamoyladenosine(37)-C(2))-methylthiotransferase [Candidatus Lokiarchaeota archaeon]|nr:tRNA (N(6)-L-threonylcarbamoyladenosine(37)-C(2))-methylthiotransferase [Candidatus Lokiarchaeota archaeon]